MWIALTLAAAISVSAAPRYSWKPAAAAQALENRFSAPRGFQRVPVQKDSFAEWLRGLPLKPGKPDVLLYNGQPKRNQDAHAAVVDMPLSRKDLHQCADALMHLRAEYLFQRGLSGQIAFHSTSGDLLQFSRWQAGQRPEVRGNRILWTQRRPADASYESFSQYLEFVYTYSGTISLARDTKPAALKDLQIGDIFLQSGSPGHAVIVVDLAKGYGTSAFLLAQSYMPAQEMHILRNKEQGGEWYRADQIGRELVTPEWTFQKDSLRRFPP